MRKEGGGGAGFQMAKKERQMFLSITARPRKGGEREREIETMTI